MGSVAEAVVLAWGSSLKDSMYGLLLGTLGIRNLVMLQSSVTDEASIAAPRYNRQDGQSILVWRRKQAGERAAPVVVETSYSDVQ